MLEGKRALVTGSARGIGAAIATRFAAAGCRVCVHYNRNAEEAQNLAASLEGGTHAVVQADVSDPSAVERLVLQATASLGGLDILVNNAGIFEAQPFDMDDYSAWQAAWKLTLDTNLMSAVNASYHAMRHFRCVGGGKIINVASRSAFRAETT